METNTTQIALALTFLLGIIRKAEMNVRITRTVVLRFANEIESGCDTVVTANRKQSARKLAQFQALRELGLVSQTFVRNDGDKDMWIFTITPEGRAFKAKFFGAVYGQHTEVGTHEVGKRARLSF